jgi:hypothetical protein
MRWFIVLVGLLHAAFMFCEMYPWSNPILLEILAEGRDPDPSYVNPDPSKDKKPWLEFGKQQQDLVADIVHNAGIYNAILAFGLFWAAYRGPQANELAIVLLMGATVAGIYGAITLNPNVAVQAVLGAVGVILVKRQSVPEPSSASISN